MGPLREAGESPFEGLKPRETKNRPWKKYKPIRDPWDWYIYIPT